MLRRLNINLVIVQDQINQFIEKINLLSCDKEFKEELVKQVEFV